MCLKRRVCLILAVCFTALIPLAVSSFAINTQDYNLVPSDILTWNSYCDNGSFTMYSTSNSAIVRGVNTGASANVGTYTYSVCAYNSVPSGFLVAGNSYSLSYSVPSDSDLIALGFSQSSIDFGWERVAFAYCGLGYFDDDGDPQLIEQCSVKYTHSEVARLSGQTNYINFVMPDYSGKQLVFLVGYYRVSNNYSGNLNLFFGRYYGLIDFQRKSELENYNRIWYGNSNGDYTNIYTTENYNVGVAGDSARIDSAINQWEAGLGEFGTPLRTAGVFLNSMFSAGGIAVIGVIVLVILMFGVILRILGVT